MAHMVQKWMEMDVQSWGGAELHLPIFWALQMEQMAG